MIFVLRWKNDHFHRGSFGGLRETREAVEQFAAAQKEYAKLLMKVQRAKKVNINLLNFFFQNVIILDL